MNYSTLYKISIAAIILALAITPLILEAIFLGVTFRSLYRRLRVGHRPLEWNHWVNILLVPVMAVAVVFAYGMAVDLVRSRPDMPPLLSLTLKYFICIYTSVLVSFGGTIAATFISVKVFGREAPLPKSKVKFCPKCSEVMTSTYCGNCGYPKASKG